MEGKKGLLAIGVSVLFFVVWYQFIVPKIWPEQAKKPTAQQEAVVKTEETKGETEQDKKTGLDKKEIAQKEVKETTSELSNGSILVTFSSYGAVPTAWKLEDYTAKKNGTSELVNLVSSDTAAFRPLEVAIQDADFVIPEVQKYEMVSKTDTELKYKWSSDKIEIEKTYILGQSGYDITLEILVKNIGEGLIKGRPSVGWTALINPEEKRGFFGFLKGPENIAMPVYMLNGSVDREKSPRTISEKEIQGKLNWAGIEDRYFLSAVAPRIENIEQDVKLASFKEGETDGFYSGVVLPKFELVKGGTEKYAITVYSGPKEMDLLKKAGLGLEKVMDYGWFSFIAIPILYVLKYLYMIVHNYGIAIILLTIIIKLLLHPISKKSMKSMKKMQQLQPRMKELKEKYKNDRDRLNAETMQLFKTYKVNPMSGCLPMILQLPVYIALYRVLWNSIELYQAPFFWFYRDLSQPDPYFITPVLLGIAMFLQQKLTPTTSADPAQQKMMMFMPLMFTAFLAFLPVGLVVYILVNTVMSVVQQWMSNNDISMLDLIKGKHRIHKKAKA